MKRIVPPLLIAFCVSPFAACGGDTVAPGTAAQGGAAGSGGADGGSGTGGSSGAAGAIDGGDASCPPIVTDASPLCEKAVTGDIFDPGEVYLTGSFGETNCGGALAHVSCPDIAAVGFDCTDEDSYIRPTDGRLLYRNANEPGVREFRMDGCVRVAGAPYDPPSPGSTTSDPLLLVGACPGGPSPTGFLVSPDGYFMLHCADGRGWSDVDGKHVYPENGDPLLYVGYDDLALTKTRLIDLKTGAGPVIDRPAGIIHAIRAVPPNKFWIALRLNAEPSEALLEVSGDGLVRQLGTFPNPPSGIVVATRGRLDKHGALYQLTTRRSDTMVEDIVMRRDIDGNFEVIYWEGANPLVRVSGSWLITGP